MGKRRRQCIGLCFGGFVLGLSGSADVKSGPQELYTFDVKARTQHLLKSLNAGQPPLEFLEDKLVDGRADGPAFTFSVPVTSVDGVAYKCSPEPPKAQTEPEDEAQDPAVASVVSEPPEKRLSVLNGTCAILNKDYWSYEWCHHREVRQFHAGPPSAPGQEPERDPDWSLGRYNRTKVFYHDEEGGEKRVSSVVDYFTRGGQMCYEINTRRSTNVQFYCCTSDRLDPEVKERIKNMQPVPMAVAQIAYVEEVSLCNYTVGVCTPLLCDPEEDASIKALSPLLKLLEPMKTLCVTRHEGYWSYEFCYKKAIRQYHTVAMRDTKGRTFSKVDAEFTIGMAQELPADFDEQKHLVLSKEERDPTHFELEYTGGTPCDLTGELRATTVQFICGEGGDQFVSIKEDRSCHYKAVISTPRLCRHSAFAKHLPTARRVRCVESSRRKS